MIVYVESNFVLELVLEQAGRAACEELLRLAEAGRLTLALPALAMFEPYYKLAGDHAKRRETKDAIFRDLTQLERTHSLEQSSRNIRNDLELLLVQSGESAMRRFESARARLLHSARVIPLDAATLRASDDPSARALKFPDALVLGSVLRDIDPTQSAESCFLNRNTKDFNDPAIRARLAQLKCTLIGSFEDGLAFVGARLAPPPGPPAPNAPTK